MNANSSLDYLVQYLLQEKNSNAVPPNGDQIEKWRLFRGLVNMREPKSVSVEFLEAQDKLLQSMIAEKGITDISELTPVRDKIYLWQGDITTLRVDAIVNAANSGMLGCFVPGHACIDNAIHTFAGVQLRLECAEIMKRQSHEETTGSAKITKAHNLPSKYILHTVGPIISGELASKDCNQLANCYKSCLTLAAEHRLESIAFCCISTGVFRFPNDKAAEIAVKTVMEFQKSSPIKVVFNVFKDTDWSIYHELLN